MQLFDRAKKYPQLTGAGQALLVEAKAVLDSMDCFKARARTMAEGLEPELSAVIDVMYPMAALTKAVGFFKQTYPRTPLLLYVEALGAVVQAVLDGRCRIGVIGSLPIVPENVQSEPLMEVPFATVVAPHHPLARIRGVVPKSSLTKHVQLVLTDRSTLSEGRSFGVLSPLTWRLADLGAKLEFLRAGFGWGHMPAPRDRGSPCQKGADKDPHRRRRRVRAPSDARRLSQGRAARAGRKGIHPATKARLTPIRPFMRRSEARAAS